MLKTHTRLPLSLSLVLALAACGGGGGTSEKAVSATPDTPTSSQTSTSTTGDNSTGSASTSSSTSSTGTTASPTVTAQAPISSAGVSGAVLSAMLDTRTPDLSILASGGSPVAVPATGRHGEALDLTDGPFVSVSQQLEPSNYVPLPEGSPFDPYVNDQYAPSLGGSLYHTSNFVQNRWNISDDAVTPYTTMEMSVGIANSNSEVSLGEVLNLSIGSGGERTSMSLTATSTYAIAKDALVGYGQVLQQWNNGLTLVQLMLQAGQEADEAELCWNVQAPNLVRLVCNGWEVPADWASGQPLKLDSYSIDDERSVYPGESGHLYWRG